MERIFATEGKITVCAPDGVTEWYEVRTLNTTHEDYSWMLSNKPTTDLPFVVTDDNVDNYRSLTVTK